MPDFAYLAALATFIFGALILSLLTAFYWNQWRRRPVANRSAVLPVFTLVCTVAFVNNLLYQAGALESTALVLVRNLVAGLLPPLMLHLVIEFVSPQASVSRWRSILLAIYGGSVCVTLAKSLSETGVLSAPSADFLYFAPATLLAATSLFAILLLAMSRRMLPPLESAHRRALLFVLVPMLVCAVANLNDEPQPLTTQMPDYLVLAFFGVTLYFRERLAFIDLLVKRGAFFAVGLVILFACLTIETVWTPSVYSLGILGLGLWLAGPAVYACIDRAIDRVWLRRPYSPIDAERQFIREIQSANTEEELRASAVRSLNIIFRSKADVRLGERLFPEEKDPEDGSLESGFEGSGTKGLLILLAPRLDGTPFLSDDRRLLQSLTGALGVMFENVQFRAERKRQEEREQHLRWLTSRAELKALRAQINPHFLFNALSVITGMIQYNPERAAEIIEELAQVFRYTLRKSDNEWTPLAEEVEFVTAYLRVEQARFGDRLKVDLHVDDAVSQIPIPAMSIQPLIENAIKHGISDKESGGVVGLRAVPNGDLALVEVFDNGSGFLPGFSLDACAEGHGLRNVMERMRGYYGDAAKLTWQSGPAGTRVVLTFPRLALYSAVAGHRDDANSYRR